MQRIVVDRPGGYKRLRLEEHPGRGPGPGEVRIEVVGAGVNFADVAVRLGLYESAKRYVGWPITPGFEVAGRVVEVGDGVDEPRVGDEVCAVTLFGGYVSELVVPAEQVFPLPAGYALADAAGFPTVFLTAWYALHRSLAVERGHTLLVHSAAGGVGGALLQLGKIAGARCVGVVGSSAKVAAARALGADVVIDKSSADLWEAARAAAPDGYDGVLDANGVETLRRSYKSLAPEGRLVVYGFHTMFRRGGERASLPRLALGWLRTPRFDPISMTNQNRSVMAFNLSFLFHRKEVLRRAMQELLGWATEGRLQALRTESVPLAEAGEAHRRLQSGETVGKLVLAP
ncbi:MAG: medium chain dehydrogenase/reductase family protein [Planctomycetota bacterium]